MTASSSSRYFGDNRSGAEHSQQSVQSGIFAIASRGIGAFVQIGSTIILARLLSPEDFGLVSMVAAFTGFIPMLSDLGTRDAAVQRPTITNAVREFEKAGLIAPGQRQIVVLDRQGLLRVSCECYQMVRRRIAFHLPKTYR